MNATPLVRDNSSSVNCFAVHRTESHISVRCSRQMAAALRLKTEGRAPGFAGVQLTEVGNSWFRLTPRDTFHTNPEVEVDKATSQLFLEFALLELERYLSTLDTEVSSVKVKKESPLKEVRALSVQGRLSSRPVKPRVSASKLAALAAFAKSKSS